MCEQEGEGGMAVENAGEVHSCDGDGGFERETEGKGEDVSGMLEGGFTAEGGGGEAVVGV